MLYVAVFDTVTVINVANWLNQESLIKKSIQLPYT